MLQRRPGAVALKEAMRKLWADRVVWTRQYIVAAVAGDASAQAASNRLLRNQEDIGSAVATYYESTAGAKLTDLLRQHILIAVDVVAAAKAGDNAKLTDADKRRHDADFKGSESLKAATACSMDHRIPVAILVRIAGDVML